MDRYEQSGDLNDLKQSRDLYAEAFQLAHDDYYTGINAAAKSIFLGETDEAVKYAEQVQAIVGTEPKTGDYWLTATVAEVFLIRQHYADAARLYKAAVAMARSEIASHQSTWKQAQRLLDKLGPTTGDRANIGSAFAHLPAN
jgi:ATP/maltotriose-dependent transcriptional regulator MalT